MRQFVLDKYFEKTKGFYPFFKYCPKKYHTHYINRRASETLSYNYNWLNPVSLNEKIRWLSYNERLKSKTLLTDKIKMKAYVASVIGEGHTAEIYGIWDKFDDIDFEYIPNEFALKANHAWRMNVFVTDKRFIEKNRPTLRKLTKLWLNTKFEYYSLEPQYRDIEPKLFIEYLRPFKDAFRDELQIHCFNGNPMMIEKLFILDKEKYSVSLFYDTDWNKLPYTAHCMLNAEDKAKREEFNLPRPECLEEIVEYARKLSSGFSYVRVDFAKSKENIHVAELTFTPCSAMIPFDNPKYDFELGDMLHIPEQKSA